MSPAAERPRFYNAVEARRDFACSESERQMLAHEVKRLWAVVSEWRKTILAFNKIKRAKVLDVSPIEQRRVNYSTFRRI
jgi:hypothetical protein